MKCIFIKPDEEQCNANSMKASGYCYLHNPNIPEEEKKAAQSRGGESNKIAISKPLPPMRLENPNDLFTLLTETINQIRTGKIDLKVATTVGYLAGQAQKAYEASNLNNRLEVIESVLLQRKISYSRGK